VSGRNRRLGSHFSGLAGVEAWAPAADPPPFPDRRGGFDLRLVGPLTQVVAVLSPHHGGTP
jgi:hypothetical protein